MENRSKAVDKDESYSLAVTPFGVRLHAALWSGPFTVSKTLHNSSSPKEDYLFRVSIRDKPRFRWRGPHDRCAATSSQSMCSKHNPRRHGCGKPQRLHWHLKRRSGFPIESKACPKLAGKGSEGLFYTQDQAREIVDYASGGRPCGAGFDMPGIPAIGSRIFPISRRAWSVTHRARVWLLPPKPVMDPTSARAL